MHRSWHEAWTAKEKAIRARMVKTCERLEQSSKELAPLREGDTVFIQNQNAASRNPNKWDREGTVIQTGENDQYLVRVHGTGRVTLRNRRFLRRFTLRSSELGDCTPPPGSMQVSSIPKGNGFSQHDSAEEPRPIPQQGTARTVQPTDDHASHPNVMPSSTQPMSGPAPCLNAPHPIAPHSQQPALAPEAVFTLQPTAVADTQPSVSCAPYARAPELVCTPQLDGVGKRSAATSTPDSIHHPRQSARAQPARLVYDASTGKHVPPCNAPPCTK